MLDGWNVKRSPHLPTLHLPTFPTFQPSRAGNGTRTRDPNLGKVVLYQLSYSRAPQNLTAHKQGIYHPVSVLQPVCHPPVGPPDGGEGDRTPDLVNAIHALSQLSYAPVILPPPKWRKSPDGNTASYRRVHAVSSDFSLVS